MNMPIVYDVLLRTEIEARDEADALKKIKSDVEAFGIEKALLSKFEVIRDDNSSKFGKDNLSRHTNGFVVFNAEQKHALLKEIARSLDAAMDGDGSPGNALINALTTQFEYLGRNTLKGVQLP